MFLFGLFSTHLPYIILMGLYFVGFGIYSSNNIREKLLSKEETSSTKEIVLKKASYSNKALQTNFSFQSQIKKQDVFISRIKAPLKLPVLVKYKYFEKREQFISLYYYSYSFSRPPPYFSA